MTHKKPHNHSNTFNKYSLVIGIVAIAAVAMAGFSYFGGRSSTAGYSCPMMRNTSSSNTNAGGCGMMGGKKTVQTQNIASSSAKQADTQPQETITMNYDESGLTPTTINVKIGQTYRIIINANTSVYGCMNAITLPGLDDNLQQIVEGNKIVFNITPTKAGTYDFVCAMGVSHGAQVIVQ